MADDEMFFCDPIDLAPEATAVPVEAGAFQLVIDEAKENLAAAQAMKDEVGIARWSKVLETASQQMEQMEIINPDPIATEDMNFLRGACIQIWGNEAGKEWFENSLSQGCKFDQLWEIVKPEMQNRGLWQKQETAPPTEDKKKRTRPGRKLKEEAAPEPKAEPEQLSPELICFNEIVEIGKAAGLLDCHLAWDELDLAELTEPNLEAFRAEIAARIEKLNQGFGDEPAPPTEYMQAGPDANERAWAAQEKPTDWLQKKVDEETGEVQLPALLKALGWTEMPTQLSTPQAEQIIDIIRTRTKRADELEAQIAKMVKPLRDSAANYDATFGSLLDKYFAENQARNQKGEYKSKILSLRTGDLSYRGSNGGFEINAESTFHDWLTKADMDTRKQYEISLIYPMSADVVERLKIEKSLLPKVEYKYDRKSLLAAVNKGTLPPVPGMLKTLPQPLLKREIK